MTAGGAGDAGDCGIASDAFQASCRVLSQLARATSTAYIADVIASADETAAADGTATGTSGAAGDEPWRAWLWRPLAKALAGLLQAALKGVTDPEGSDKGGEPDPADDDEEEGGDEGGDVGGGGVTPQRAAGLRGAVDAYAAVDAAVAAACAAVASGSASGSDSGGTAGDATALGEELRSECVDRLVVRAAWTDHPAPGSGDDVSRNGDLPASCLAPSPALARPPGPWRLARAVFGALARARTLARLDSPSPSLHAAQAWVTPAALLLRPPNHSGDAGGGLVALQAAAERQLRALAVDALSTLATDTAGGTATAVAVTGAVALLVGPCVACRSLRAVNAVLSAVPPGHALPHGSGLGSWLAEAAAAALAPDAPPTDTLQGPSAAATAAAATLPDRAYFLVLVAALGADVEAGRGLFRRAAAGWRGAGAGSKAAMWLALSLAPAGLGGRGASADPDQVGSEDGGEKGARDCEAAVADLLVAAFFARTRDQRRPRAPAPDPSSSPSHISQHPPVLCWADVRRHLLPRLPPHVAKAFTDNVAAQLRASLLDEPHSEAAQQAASQDPQAPRAPQQAAAGVAGAAAGASTAPRAAGRGVGGGGTFQPRKWARNACGLLALAADATRDASAPAPVPATAPAPAAAAVAAPVTTHVAAPTDVAVAVPVDDTAATATARAPVTAPASPSAGLTGAAAALVSIGLADGDFWGVKRLQRITRRAAACLLHLRALWRGDDTDDADAGDGDGDGDAVDADAEIGGEGGFPLLTQCISCDLSLVGMMFFSFVRDEAADAAIGETDGAAARARRLLRRCVRDAAPMARDKAAGVLIVTASSFASMAEEKGMAGGDEAIRAAFWSLLDDYDLLWRERQQRLYEEAAEAGDDGGEKGDGCGAGDDGGDGDGDDDGGNEKTMLQCCCYNVALVNLRSDPVSKTDKLQNGLWLATALLQALTVPDNAFASSNDVFDAVGWRGRSALRMWCDSVAAAVAVATETIRIKGAGTLVIPMKVK